MLSPMAEARFPEEVRALVQHHVATMLHLDALLLLAATPGTLSAAEVAVAVGADADAAERAIRDLAASRLVVVEGEGDGARFHFAPADAALRRTAELLRETYRCFPVQVVRAVYERPTDPAQPPADAILPEEG